MLEVQGIATARKDAFPYSGLRVLGFIQLTNGLLVFLLGVLDLALTLVSYNNDIETYGPKYEDIVTLTVASTPLWGGMWKLTFLVLNILCAALFGPVCAVLCGILAIWVIALFLHLRHTLDPDSYHWLLLLLICFMAVLEVIVAAATSSVACCCSPIRGTQVHILVNPSTESNGKDTTTPPAHRSRPSVLAQDEKETPPRHVRPLPQANARSEQHDYSFPDHQSHASHVSRGRARTEIEIPKEEEDSGVRELNTHTLNQENNQMRQEQPEEDDNHKYDGFGDTHFGSYTRLKKWALPNW